MAEENKMDNEELQKEEPVTDTEEITEDTEEVTETAETEETGNEAEEGKGFFKKKKDKDIIEKILPVVDNFERGLATIPEDDKATPVAEGMDKIYRQLTKMLEDVGVKEIDACGKEFNPDYHNAVMHVEDEAFGENEVAEVLQKGYTYRDTVVRHSMVKVAN